jgi:hypothetical protein
MIGRFGLIQWGSQWRLAFNVQRSTFNVQRLAFGVAGGARVSFNVQQAGRRSILEISPYPYFHLTALKNARQTPNAKRQTPNAKRQTLNVER